MMKGIKLFDIVQKPVLTSRDSAKSIIPALSKHSNYGNNPLRLDFSGTKGVSPSFFDEALSVAEECIRNSGLTNSTIIWGHPPVSVSSSHHAIARAHGRTLVELENGDWEFSKA